jgi:signal transduction histidine kinase
VSLAQLLLVGGSIGGLSFALGRRSGLALSESYRQNATVVELSSHLERRLQAPIQINALNQRWLQLQPERQRNVPALGERFWHQLQAFDVDYINFGAADGSFVGVERKRDGSLQLLEDSERQGRGVLAVYALNEQGTPQRLLERIPGMTALHEEAWYTETAKAGRPLWSSIYAWEDQPEVFSISHNAPVKGPNGQLQGVVGVDLVLGNLSQWLARIWRHQRGLALIVEGDGRLVASSRPELTLQRDPQGMGRAQLSELNHPLAQALRRRYFPGKRPPPLGGREAKAQLSQVRLGGQTLLLSATPWGQEQGLNWILLTALDAEAASHAAERDSLLGLLLASAALAAAAALSYRQIRGLLLPLRQLEGASTGVRDHLVHASGPATPSDLHFTSGVTHRAGAELVALDRAIGDLVEAYNAANQRLQEGRERERLRDAQTLALLKDKLRSSLQAAAVAHEIKEPLSVVLLQSQLLLEGSGKTKTVSLPAPWRTGLQTICREAQRVGSTIETMRTLLRSAQSEQQPLDLRDVVASALLYARSGGSTARVPIDSSQLEQTRPQQDPEPAWIHGDAVQIQIAIINLLRNAAEVLLQAAVPEPLIRLRLWPQDGCWWLEVLDNGPGLSPATAEAIAPHTTKPQGSGLGLFVVRTTMENHRGSLEIHDSPTGGACLRLRFPARNAPPPELPTTGD